MPPRLTGLLSNSRAPKGAIRTLQFSAANLPAPGNAAIPFIRIIAAGIDCALSSSSDAVGTVGNAGQLQYTATDATTAWIDVVFPSAGDAVGTALNLCFSRDGGGSSGTYVPVLDGGGSYATFQLDQQYVYNADETCVRSNSPVSCCGSATEIKIMGDVVTIKEQAFKECTTVTSVDFSTATNLEVIQAKAFTGMTKLGFSLLTLDLSPATSLQTVGESAFNECTALGSAKLSTTITDIHANAFTNTALTHSSVVDFNGVECASAISAAASAPFMFNCDFQLVWSASSNCAYSTGGGPCCLSTQTQVLIKADVVSLLDKAFKKCTGMKSVYFGAGNVQLETVGTSAFDDCRQLKTIDLSRAQQLQQIGSSAFARCAAMNAIVFPGTSTFTAIQSSAFTSTGVTQASQVTWNGVNCTDLTGNGAWPFDFASCPGPIQTIFSVDTSVSDTSIPIGGARVLRFTASNLDTSIARPFVKMVAQGAGCGDKDDVSDAIVNAQLTFISAGMGEVSLMSAGSQSGILCWRTGPNAIGPYTAVTAGAISVTAAYVYTAATKCKFDLNIVGGSNIQCCGTAESIVIASDVSEIATNAFFACRSITSVDFSQATSLQKIGYFAFQECDSLTTIDLSLAPELYEIGDQAFDACDNLDTVKLAATITRIKVNAFTGSKLTTASTVDFNGVICKAAAPDDAFMFSCPSVSGTYFVDKTNTCTHSSSPPASSPCCDLATTVILSSDLVTVISGALRDCEATEIVFTYATALTTIETGGFQSMSDLISLTDFEKATALTVIGYAAFNFCIKLKNMKLPPNINQLDRGAFSSTDLLSASRVDFNGVDCAAVCAAAISAYPSNPPFEFTCPLVLPTGAPTSAPSSAPSFAPTRAPTGAPSTAPTATLATWVPTTAPTAAPTSTPSHAPTHTFVPTSAPSAAPTHTPTSSPTRELGNFVVYTTPIVVREDGGGQSLLTISSTTSASTGETVTVSCMANASFVRLIDASAIEIGSSGVENGRKGFNIEASWDTTQQVLRETEIECNVYSSQSWKAPAPIGISVRVEGVEQPSVSEFCSTNTSALTTPRALLAGCSKEDADYPSFFNTNGGDMIVVFGGICPTCPQPPFSTATSVSINGIDLDIAVSASGDRIEFTTPTKPEMEAAIASSGGLLLPFRFNTYYPFVIEALGLGASVSSSSGNGKLSLGPGAASATGTDPAQLLCGVEEGHHLCPPARVDKSGAYYLDRCLGFPNPKIDTRWKTTDDPAISSSFAYGTPPYCRPCPEGCRCPGGDRCYTIPGWWLVGDSLGGGNGPIQCHAEMAVAIKRCRGYSKIADSTTCALGYSGSLCASCSLGYFADDTAGGACTLCPPSADVAATALWIGVFFSAIALVAFVIVAIVQSAFGRDIKSGAVRSIRFAGWIISALAMQAQIGRTASSTQSSIIRQYYTLLQVFEINPDAAQPSQCADNASTVAIVAMVVSTSAVLLFITLAIPWVEHVCVRGGDLTQAKICYLIKKLKSTKKKRGGWGHRGDPEDGQEVDGSVSATMGRADAVRRRRRKGRTETTRATAVRIVGLSDGLGVIDQPQRTGKARRMLGSTAGRQLVVSTRAGSITTLRSNPMASKKRLHSAKSKQRLNAAENAVGVEMTSLGGISRGLNGGLGANVSDAGPPSNGTAAEKDGPVREVSAMRWRARTRTASELDPDAATALTRANDEAAIHQLVLEYRINQNGSLDDMLDGGKKSKCCRCCIDKKKSTKKKRKKKQGKQGCSLVLGYCRKGLTGLIFLLHPLVANVAFKSVHCVSFETEELGTQWVVAAAPSVECDSEAHLGIYVLAWIAIAVTIVGFPLYALAMLARDAEWWRCVRVVQRSEAAAEEEVNGGKVPIPPFRPTRFEDALSSLELDDEVEMTTRVLSLQGETANVARHSHEEAANGKSEAEGGGDSNATPRVEALPRFSELVPAISHQTRVNSNLLSSESRLSLFSGRKSDSAPDVLQLRGGDSNADVNTGRTSVAAMAIEAYVSSDPTGGAGPVSGGLCCGCSAIISCMRISRHAFEMKHHKRVFPTRHFSWSSFTDSDWKPEHFWFRLVFFTSLTTLAMSNTFLNPDYILDANAFPKQFVNTLQVIRFAICAAAVMTPCVMLVAFLPMKLSSRWKLPLRMLIATVSVGMLTLNATVRWAKWSGRSPAFRALLDTLAYVMLAMCVLLLFAMAILFVIFVACRGAALQKKIEDTSADNEEIRALGAALHAHIIRRSGLRALRAWHELVRVGSDVCRDDLGDEDSEEGGGSGSIIGRVLHIHEEGNEEEEEEDCDGGDGNDGAGGDEAWRARMEETSRISLPPGWKFAHDNDLIYYYHTDSGETSWSKPKTSQPPPDPTDSTTADGLPPGWICLLDVASGRTYYCHAETEQTQWEAPTPLPSGWSMSLELTPSRRIVFVNYLTSERVYDVQPEELAEGWKIAHTDDGKLFYTNAAKGTSMWVRPKPKPQQRRSNAVRTSISERLSIFGGALLFGDSSSSMPGTPRRSRASTSSSTGGSRRSSSRFGFGISYSGHNRMPSSGNSSGGSVISDLETFQSTRNLIGGTYVKKKKKKKKTSTTSQAEAAATPTTTKEVTRTVTWRKRRKSAATLRDAIYGEEDQDKEDVDACVSALFGKKKTLSVQATLKVLRGKTSTRPRVTSSGSSSSSSPVVSRARARTGGGSDALSGNLLAQMKLVEAATDDDIGGSHRVDREEFIKQVHEAVLREPSGAVAAWVLDELEAAEEESLPSDEL